jgi:2-succinyl-6-hydroxy-2,4-cyclohexadiene-1-carboxylate synthase
MLIYANNVEYHVEIVGQGEPVLLLHGFTGDISTWKSLANHLKSQYQVVMVDILGHGLTDSSENSLRYHIGKIADDLKEIFFHLNIQQINILGYSMGGRLALTFAHMYPEMTNSLILESASPGLINEDDRSARKKQDEILAHKIIEDGIESFVEYWGNIPLFQTQKSLPHTIQNNIREQRLKNNPIGLANSLLGMGTGSQPSWWNDLKHMQMPVLLITGGLDEKFCGIANDMKMLMSNVEQVTVPNVGHAIHVESPKKFDTIVMKFLTKLF